MNDYKRRLLYEYAFIKRKFIRLHNTLVKYEVSVIKNEPLDIGNVDLLRRQIEIMNQYLYTLEVRAELEGIGIEQLYGCMVGEDNLCDDEYEMITEDSNAEGGENNGCS
jgi:hypothetical protein